MGTPFLDAFQQLGPAALMVLGLVGLLLVYFMLTNRVAGLFFVLVLGAAFVGSAVSGIDSFATIARWIATLLLFLSVVFMDRLVIPQGPLLFLGYASFGFIGLFFANSDSWQIQRGVLLIAVAAAIPLALSNRPWRTYMQALSGVIVIATIFAAHNFVSLPAHLGEASRLSGYAKAAPWFAMVLGGLLPFSLWGFWNAPRQWLRLLSGAGFLMGAITLGFSAQRAGTIAGLIGIAPLLFLALKGRRTVVWTVLLVVMVSLIGMIYFRESSSQRVAFLLSRYNRTEGLSNREAIWDLAISEIGKSPLIGRGTGAAETVFSSSFHNTWLEVWYNAGLPGLVLFIAAQFYFFYRIYVLSRTFRNPAARPVLALVLGYMLGFFALCTVESVGAGASNINIVLYIFLGVLISQKNLLGSLGAMTETPAVGPDRLPEPS